MAAVFYVVVACFLLPSPASSTVPCNCYRPADLVKELTMGEKDVDEAFGGLDVDGNGEITQSDLDNLFYHSHAELARQTFLELIKNPATKGDDQDIRELTTFMNDKPVTLAIYSCKYFKSESLRKSCFSDRILYYVYLMMDVPTTISQFYAAFKKKCGIEYDGVCLDDVMKLTGMISDFGDEDARVLLREVAQERRRFTQTEFTKYVTQEDILDDFRACRTMTDENKAKYDDNCLLLQLMRFTMDHLTEIEIAGIFNAFNIGNDRRILASYVEKATECDDEIAKRFVEMMDQNNDESVDYAELRHFVKLHTVKLNFERECSEVIHNAKRLTNCYKDQLMKAVQEHHRPLSIWFWMPDLDILFIFEELNVKNDGQIKVEHDLINDLKWNEELVDRFIEEVSPDEEKDISLEEFSEYIHEPNLIFALAECMTLPKGKERISCYVNEFKEMLLIMMKKELAKDFFDYLDVDEDEQLKSDDLKSRGIRSEEVSIFLKEMGMGDSVVTKREFYWYIRQQELSHMIKAADTEDFAVLTKVLTKYIKTKMTEYDIQMLFKKFDADHDFEITSSDISKLDIPIDISSAKLNDPRVFGGRINFNEFWLYINSPVGSPRKKDLENACNQISESKEEDIEGKKEAIENKKGAIEGNADDTEEKKGKEEDIKKKEDATESEKKAIECYMKQFWSLRDDTHGSPSPQIPDNDDHSKSEVNQHENSASTTQESS